MRTAFAPGRVNLIGDHTDYSGGFVLPVATDLGTTVALEPGGDRLELHSTADPAPCSLALDLADPATVEPAWARYAAGVIAVVRPASGGRGTVTTTLPVAAGLSSSAALEVAVALALGAGTDDPTGLARQCQEAERLASGVPCGVMDQLASVAGVAGHALLIDCATLAVSPVPVPDDAEILVFHSGVARALAGSAYAQRRSEVERAVAVAGDLRAATTGDLAAIDDPIVRQRARHVVTENARVLEFADTLAAGDLTHAGALMSASHRSLRDDFAVSTPELDRLVAGLEKTTGITGARLTGAGFGGCVVALARRGVFREADGTRPWVITPSAGARVTDAAAGR